MSVAARGVGDVDKRQEQKAVVTVAGKAFGSDGNVRFSYAASDEDLARAMDLVEETLKELE